MIQRKVLCGMGWAKWEGVMMKGLGEGSKWERLASHRWL